MRIYLTTNFYLPRPENEDEKNIVPSWKLRMEGHLLKEMQAFKTDGPRQKQKFSTYFKRLVIELDREFYFLYGQLTTKKEDLKDLMAD